MQNNEFTRNQLVCMIFISLRFCLCCEAFSFTIFQRKIRKMINNFCSCRFLGHNLVTKWIARSHSPQSISLLPISFTMREKKNTIKETNTSLLTCKFVRLFGLDNWLKIDALLRILFGLCYWCVCVLNKFSLHQTSLFYGKYKVCWFSFLPFLWCGEKMSNSLTR